MQKCKHEIFMTAKQIDAVKKWWNVVTVEKNRQLLHTLGQQRKQVKILIFAHQLSQV